MLRLKYSYRLNVRICSRFLASIIDLRGTFVNLPEMHIKWHLHAKLIHGVFRISNAGLVDGFFKWPSKPIQSKNASSSNEISVVT